MAQNKAAMPTIARLMKRFSLYTLVGICAGASASAFLYLLDIATRMRLEHPGLIWFLPLAGLGIGLLYHHFGRETERGNNLILDEIHEPKNTLPLRMAPLVFFGTIATHLFGGSAGREGTAVQLGATFADQISKLFKVGPQERKMALMAGMGAAFGAAIGAPFAGAIFGMEVVQVGKFKIAAWLECVVAAFCAFAITKLLHAPHSIFPRLATPQWSWLLPLYVVVAGILFGLLARAFIIFEREVAAQLHRFLRYPPLRPLVGGILMVALFYWEGTYQYAGLGLEVIQRSLQESASWPTPFLKLGFTALTVASGFKGGEFVPLVFMGATLGSAMAPLFSLAPGFLGSLGFAATFGAAANTPIACSLMAIELFGSAAAPYAIIACFSAYLVSGQSGIYSSQRTRSGERV